MDSNSPQVGDVGTKIVVVVRDETGAVVDVSAASELTVYLYTPAGTLSRTGAIDTDGTDGRVKYVTTIDDFTVPGAYAVRAKVVIGGNTWRSKRQTFSVES